MSAIDIYNNWKKTPPVEADWRDVQKLLDYYFESNFRWKDGSHVIVTEPLFKKHKVHEGTKLCNYQGEICITVMNGRKVKGVYVKFLIEGIELKEEITKQEAEYGRK